MIWGYHDFFFGNTHMGKRDQFIFPSKELTNDFRLF